MLYCSFGQFETQKTLKRTENTETGRTQALPLQDHPLNVIANVVKQSEKIHLQLLLLL